MHQLVAPMVSGLWLWTGPHCADVHHRSRVRSTWLGSSSEPGALNSASEGHVGKSLMASTIKKPLAPPKRSPPKAKVRMSGVARPALNAGKKLLKRAWPIAPCALQPASAKASPAPAPADVEHKIDPRLMATTMSRSFVMRAEAPKEPVQIDDSDALFAQAAGDPNQLHTVAVRTGFLVVSALLVHTRARWYHHGGIMGMAQLSLAT